MPVAGMKQDTFEDVLEDEVSEPAEETVSEEEI